MSCGNTNNNYKSSLVSVTTTVAEALPLNKDRTNLILFNQGTETVQVYFDANSTIYFEIEANKGAHFFGGAPINVINVITASGTSTLSVLEA